MARGGRGSVHDEFRLLAAAAVDGRIDPDSAASLEAHLASCAACRADQSAMVADHAWLATPGPASWPAPRVREFVLEAARAPRVPSIGAPARPWSALAAAALMVAVVGAGLLFASLRPPDGIGNVGGTATPTPAATDAAISTCVPVPGGLAARWNFDGTQQDRIGGLEVELAREARIGEGLNGHGLHLPGPEGEATVFDPHIPDLGTADFTLSLWVRFERDARDQVLVEQWDQASLAGWTLATIGTGQVRLAVGTDRGELDVDTSEVFLTPDFWHHVVARRQGRTFEINVNGRWAASTRLAEGEEAIVTAARPLLFGRRGDTEAYHLVGDLDEVLIWTGRALGGDEIKDLRRAGNAGFCEAAAGAGYAGTWEAVDCATSGSVRNCSLWGDGSVIRLVIEDAEQPVVSYQDPSETGCAPGVAIGPREATGTGTFDGTWLHVTFTEVSCDRQSGNWSNPVTFYRTIGQAELWDDPDGDGWGLLWTPE